MAAATAPASSLPPAAYPPDGNFAQPTQTPSFFPGLSQAGVPQTGEFYPENVPLPDPEFPIEDKSESALYLKQVQLGEKLMTVEEFQNVLCCCLLKIAPHPHNAPIALALSDLPMFTPTRVHVKNQFRKVDAILHLSLTPPTPHECVTLPRLRESTWVDIVSHYTKYVLISDNNEAPSFIRGNVLGSNSNLKQVVDGVVEVLSADNTAYLTTTASNLSNKDVDLLVCRFYAICEQLVNTDVVAELLVRDVEGFKKIIRYLESFLDFIIRTHGARNHNQFQGLTNEHLKVLVAGTVILSQGLTKSRAVTRLVIYPERDCLRTAEKSLTDPVFKQHGFTHDCFNLVRFAVDLTPQIPEVVHPMLGILFKFLVHR